MNFDILLQNIGNKQFTNNYNQTDTILKIMIEEYKNLKEYCILNNIDISDVGYDTNYNKYNDFVSELLYYNNNDMIVEIIKLDNILKIINEKKNQHLLKQSNTKIIKTSEGKYDFKTIIFNSLGVLLLFCLFIYSYKLFKFIFSILKFIIIYLLKPIFRLLAEFTSSSNYRDFKYKDTIKYCINIFISWTKYFNISDYLKDTIVIIDNNINNNHVGGANNITTEFKFTTDKILELYKKRYDLTNYIKLICEYLKITQPTYYQQSIEIYNQYAYSINIFIVRLLNNILNALINHINSMNTLTEYNDTILYNHEFLELLVVFILRLYKLFQYYLIESIKSMTTNNIDIYIEKRKTLFNNDNFETQINECKKILEKYGKIKIKNTIDYTKLQKQYDKLKELGYFNIFNSDVQINDKKYELIEENKINILFSNHNITFIYSLLGNYILPFSIIFLIRSISQKQTVYDKLYIYIAYQLNITYSEIKKTSQFTDKLNEYKNETNLEKILIELYYTIHTDEIKPQLDEINKFLESENKEKKKFYQEIQLILQSIPNTQSAGSAGKLSKPSIIKSHMDYQKSILIYKLYKIKKIIIDLINRFNIISIEIINYINKIFYNIDKILSITVSSVSLKATKYEEYKTEYILSVDEIFNKLIENVNNYTTFLYTTIEALYYRFYKNINLIIKLIIHNYNNYLLQLIDLGYPVNQNNYKYEDITLYFEFLTTLYDLFDNNNSDDIITKIDETLKKINILQNKEIINNPDETLQGVIEIKGGAEPVTDKLQSIDYTMLKTQYDKLISPELKYFKTEEQLREDIKKDMIIIEKIKNNYSIKELDFINKLFTNPNILFIYSMLSNYILPCCIIILIKKIPQETIPIYKKLYTCIAEKINDFYFKIKKNLIFTQTIDEMSNKYIDDTTYTLEYILIELYYRTYIPIANKKLELTAIQAKLKELKELKELKPELSELYDFYSNLKKILSHIANFSMLKGGSVKKLIAAQKLNLTEKSQRYNRKILVISKLYNLKTLIINIITKFNTNYKNNYITMIFNIKINSFDNMFWFDNLIEDINTKFNNMINYINRIGGIELLTQIELSYYHFYDYIIKFIKFIISQYNDYLNSINNRIGQLFYTSNYIEPIVDLLIEIYNLLKLENDVELDIIEIIKETLKKIKDKEQTPIQIIAEDKTEPTEPKDKIIIIKSIDWEDIEEQIKKYKRTN